MRHPRKLLFLLSVALLLSVGLERSLRAQDLDTVTISGRVTDPNGALIPGASLTATLFDGGVERTAVTGADGNYKLIQLPPGTYHVKASSPNFAIEEKTGLVTVAAQNVRLDFTLKPAAVIAETVVISAADPTHVDTTRTIVGGTITIQEVEALPIPSRSPLDLVFTVGGVAEEPLSVRDLATDPAARTTPEEAGNFSISGGAAYSNNITIDGLDNNDDRSARERFNPSIEAVEEVQIIRNQFAAEYGRASGGRVNVRTRGGANKLHGRGFYFFRDESLDANSWKNNTLGLKRLPLQEHDPGFTLSGPIIIPKAYGGMNRTFFFTAYEYDTFLDSTTIDTLVPVDENPRFPLPAPTHPALRRAENAPAPALIAPNGIAPFISSVNTPQRTHTFTARVDHKYTDMHNGSIVFQLGRFRNQRQFGGGDRLAEALVGQTRNTYAFSYAEDHVLSARAVAQTRFQYSGLTPTVVAKGGSKNPVVLISIHDSAAVNSGTLVAGTSTSGSSDRREKRFQFQEIFAYIAGSHSLKFGGDLQRINSTFINLADASGTWNFDSAGDFLAGVPSRFRQNFLTTSTQRNTYFGIYGQDEWRLKSNLVVSLGLRYEFESIINDPNNFGPRLAIAYDPLKTGKTVVRAGAGIFYNRALLRTIDDFASGSQQLFFDTDALTDLSTGKLLSETQRRAFIAANLHFPDTLSVNSPLVKRLAVGNTGTSNAGGLLRRLDPSLRIPESYQANIGIEREIRSNLVIEANYTLNHSLHLWREFNINAPVLPGSFKSFTDYLASRDFTNFLLQPGGTRPLLNTSTAGDLVRFVMAPSDAANPNAVVRISEFGVPVSLINLNSFTSTTSVNTALAALNSLRPEPAKGEVEDLIPTGNSYYHGLTLEVRNRFRQGQKGLALSFRAAYTLSSLKDDGVVNTSDALVAGDFRGEWARGLQDRRHRFVISGNLEMPGFLGGVQISPVLRVASGAPFNIGLGGADRNLDDVSNDRPIYLGDTSKLKWRRPGSAFDRSILDQFRLPTVGQTGNLPRNAGTGPGQFFFDLSVTRSFKFGERVRLRPVAEFDNILNTTVFTFGSEFIDFNALGPTSSEATKQGFIDSFLVPSRTLRPRQIRLGIRLDF